MRRFIPQLGNGGYVRNKVRTVKYGAVKEKNAQASALRVVMRYSKELPCPEAGHNEQ
jgi:hypothetical protein